MNENTIMIILKEFRPSVLNTYENIIKKAAIIAIAIIVLSLTFVKSFKKIKIKSTEAPKTKRALIFKIITVFDFQKLNFFIQPCRITCQLIVLAHYPVTWNYNGYQICSNGAAYCLSRHCGRNHRRNFTIGYRFAIWDL